MDMVGGGFSQELSVIGPQKASFKATFPLRYGGATDDPGDFGLIMQAAGWTQSAPSSNVITWTPENVQSAWKDATVWGYSGNKSSSGSLLTKLGNMMGNGRLSLDFDKGVAQIEFDGKGMFTAAPTDATQEAYTRNNSAVKPLKGATISIMGDSDYDPVSFELDFGQDVGQAVKPSDASGMGVSTIAKRKIKWSCKVYKDTVATSAPITALLAGTTAAISIVWGAKPQLWTITITAAQIEKAASSDQNGIECYDLSGLILNNACTISLDTASA
jgi:hypothetical protein